MTPFDLKLQNLLLPLQAKQVHTWWLPLASLGSLAAFEERSSLLLAEDEKERAARYRFAKDRLQFLLGRASLRILLGGYVKRLPEELRFTVNRFGKPSLQTTLAEPHLQFNVSHSGNVVLLAFALRTELGVDVEEVRQVSDMDAVAKKCLSAEQFQSFRKGDYGDKQRAFFRFWTRKEALIKAIGTGFSQPLAAFDVTIDPLQPPRLIRATADFGKISEWTLHELDAPAGFQATLALHGTGYSLQSFVLPDEG